MGYFHCSNYDKLLNCLILHCYIIVVELLSFIISKLDITVREKGYWFGKLRPGMLDN